jgi:hypothetical protein
MGQCHVKNDTRHKVYLEFLDTLGHTAVWQHRIRPGRQCDIGATHGYLKLTIKDANNKSVVQSMMRVTPGKDKVYSCSYVMENGTKKMDHGFIWDAAAKAAKVVKVVEQSGITQPSWAEPCVGWCPSFRPSGITSMTSMTSTSTFDGIAEPPSRACSSSKSYRY